MLFEQLGKRIKQKRLDVGLSQSDLANSVNCRRSAIPEIENGTILPTSVTFFKICSVLDISPDYLLQDVDEKFLDYAILGYLSRIDTIQSLDLLHETVDIIEKSDNNEGD